MCVETDEQRAARLMRMRESCEPEISRVNSARAETIRCFRAKAKRYANTDLSRFTNDELWKMMWDAAKKMVESKEDGVLNEGELRVLLKRAEDAAAERNVKVIHHSVTHQHAQSLVTMVQWFSKMIKVRGVDTPNLTVGYCDELVKDLSKKE